MLGQRYPAVILGGQHRRTRQPWSGLTRDGLLGGDGPASPDLWTCRRGVANSVLPPVPRASTPLNNTTTLKISFLENSHRPGSVVSTGSIESAESELIHMNPIRFT
jgi:hypothetical protein